MKVKKILVLLVSILLLISPKLVDAEGQLTLKVGESETITLTQTITSCESNNSSVATVDSSSCKVTAIAKGNATITVTFEELNEDGSNKTDTYEVTVEEEPEPSPSPSPSSTPATEVDLTIKTVSITGAKVEKADDDNTYNVTVTDESKFSIDNKNVKITLNDKTESAVWILGSVDSKNEFKVVVTNKNDNSKKNTYTFKIIKESENTYLSKLQIIGYSFNETFNKDTTRYTVTIPYEVDAVTVRATPEDSNATVKPGLEFTEDDIGVGGNTITVTVTNGSESRKYTIYVTRSDQSEIETETTSIVSSRIKNSSSTSKDDNFNIPDTKNPDSIINYIIITLGALVLFAIGGIGIYFFIKTSPKRMKKELLKERQEKEESPIVEIKENKIESLDLEDIKEFKN